MIPLVYIVGPYANSYIVHLVNKWKINLVTKDTLKKKIIAKTTRRKKSSMLIESAVLFLNKLTRLVRR